MVDEEWEGIEEHATESAMDTKEFMETMAKVHIGSRIHLVLDGRPN